MEKKRPQLNFADLHRLKWLLGSVLVLLSVSTVFYLDIPAWPLLLLTGGAVLGVMWQPALPARVPALVHRLAFPAIVAFFIGDIYWTTEVLPALVRLDLLLLLYRGVTYRQRRDDLQIIVLGLFLIVLAGVLTVSLLFAVQILAFSAVALAFLLVVTLVQANEAGRPVVPVKPGEIPAWAQGNWQGLGRRVRAALDWRIALLGGGLFGGLVVVSALLFLAIPRFELENSLFLERFMTKKSRTGFSDRIKFGDVTDIQQDNGVAVSIDLTDPTRIPAQPYWRMVVLDDYREETFRLSPLLQRSAFSRERSAAALRGAARARLGATDYWIFYMEAGVSRYLPLAGNFEMLRFRERQNFRTANELGLVALRDEPVSMTAYRVEGMQISPALPDPEFAAQLQARQRAGDAGKLTVLRLGFGQTDRDKLQQITREITGGEILAVDEFARRTSAWLARRHRYGLKSRAPAGGGDALVSWLASGEPGHCELFAGALVLLARTETIPARVVTGFRGGSWNGFSNNYTLRNSDAHAWVELFDAASQSWLRADPTPGANAIGLDATALTAGQTRVVDRSWTARFDSLRIFWYRRIVNFDQRTQVETIKAVKSATQETGRRLRLWLQTLGTRVKDWLATPWDARRLAQWLTTAGLMASVVWLGGKGLKLLWRHQWRGRHGRMHPTRIEAGKWLQRWRGREIEPALRRDLERLRFGAEPAWPKAEEVFRRARRHWRSGRRQPVSLS